MEQALEALEHWQLNGYIDPHTLAKETIAAIAALKEAIKQAGEPVAFYVLDNGDLMPLYPNLLTIPKEREVKHAPEGESYRSDVYREGYDEGWNDCRKSMLVAMSTSHQGDKP